MTVVLLASGLVAATVIVASVWLLGSGPAPQDAAPVPVRSAGADPDAPAVDGSEVLPPDDAQRPTDRLPPMEPSTPLVSAPLPESAAVRGGVVAGFPSDVASPPDGSEVLDTSVATEGEVMQFSLRARSEGAESDIEEHYRTLWTSLGLSQVDSDGLLSFRDGYSSVTLATEVTGTGLVYTIYGVLRAA